jgi:hypothetical protein|tara:strand:+ start:331 stop:1062 length:732 start_codon:yes stop_codon:yes gene_type:complete
MEKLKYKKFDYPLCAEIPQLKPDMELITRFMNENNDQWLDNFTAHPGITLSNAQVAVDTFHLIDHIALTGPSEAEGDGIDNIAAVPEDAEGRAKHTAKLGTVIKTKDKLSGKAGHLLNEYNWGKPAEFYKDSELHEHITDLFKAPVIRVRYSKMKPGAQITPHIDYNTTYAVRFIIPIDGNEGVENKFWLKKEENTFNLEHGKVYFLNIGYTHAVYHKGTSERRYLIGSLGGQQDIESIRYDK